MNIIYYTCDVFTSKRFGGNPLAVIPHAHKIPEEALPLITKEFQYSETAFVYPPKNSSNTRRVRIFTPGAELPFAGHPTLGTAFVLASIGEVSATGSETQIIFEEGIGNVPVKILAENGTPTFMQLTAAKLPEFFPAPSRDAVVDFLSLSYADADESFPVQVVSCGVPFLFIAIRSRDALKRIKINMEKMERVLQNCTAKDVFVFTTDAEQADFHFRARMFAPLLGIPEDPATGSAAASFAGYLAEKNSVQSGTLTWNIEQGFEMGRPSMLAIEAEKFNGAVSAIRVGGSAVMVCKGEMKL